MAGRALMLQRFREQTCSGRLVHRGDRRVIDLGRDPCTLGRGPGGVTVPLPGARVSRRHARVELTPVGRHRLVDLGSTNGTFVNERRVESALLEPLDRVRIGDHLFVYLDPATSADKVAELLSPTETSCTPPARGPVEERLLGLALQLEEGDPGEALGEVLAELLDLTGHAQGMVLVEDEGGLGVARAHGPAAQRLARDELGAFQPAVAAALEERRLGWRRSPLAEDTLVIPMVLGAPDGVERRKVRAGGLRGALLLAGRPSRWEPSPEEEALLRALARRIALLLSNARLERQVTTDRLTELPNRAYLERLLGQELARARSTGQPLGVVLVDVDDFKRVNDTLGHAVGDAVLRHLARQLSLTVRASDTAGRWGGEEFLLVLPDTDLAGAVQVARKVVAAIASSVEPRHEVGVTISAGVAAVPDHGGEVAALLEAADQALYRAKRAGKNRAIAADGAPAADGSTERLFLPPRGSASPTVAWLEGAKLGSIPLRAGVYSVGRGPASDVLLPHPSVSRDHGLLLVGEDGGVRYEDTSRNGTTLDGVPVVGPTSLPAGSVLRVGPYDLRLRRREDEAALLQTAVGLQAS